MSQEQQQQPKRWALAIHGGAGAISREFDPARLEYLAALRRALAAGSKILAAGGTAVDASIACVVVMENEPLFNAGVGSVITASGTHELDAGVMRGSDMKAGAVAAVQHIEHPVELAKLVMERSAHVLLISEGAEAFARSQGVPMVDNSHFTTPARLQIHRELLAQAEQLMIEQQQQQQQQLAAQAGDMTISTPSAGWAPTASPAPPTALKPILDHSAEAMVFGKQQQSALSPSVSIEPISSSPSNAAAASGGAGSIIAPIATHPSSGSSSSTTGFCLSPTSAFSTPASIAAATAANALPPLDSTSAADSTTTTTTASSSSSDPNSNAALLAEGSLREKKFGTVGAVALDMSGGLASAISTGGMSLKSFGRVGDSPLVGCGFYATPKVAVACTGNGEAFIRAATAKDVSCLMEYRGMNVKKAADQAIRNGEQICGKEDFCGGLIAIDAQGNIAQSYNSFGMYRGRVTSDDEEAKVFVWEE